jgi:hypothetical protein
MRPPHGSQGAGATDGAPAKPERRQDLGAHVDPRFIFANEQHVPGVKSHGAGEENVEIVRLAHKALNVGDP